MVDDYANIDSCTTFLLLWVLPHKGIVCNRHIPSILWYTILWSGCKYFWMRITSSPMFVKIYECFIISLCPKQYWESPMR